jgi:hypothetical protein
MEVIQSIELEILNVKEKLIGGYLTQHSKRSGIHISDTITCLRRTVFTHLDPNPIKTINDKQLKYYIQGELTHGKLEEWLGKDFDCEREIVGLRRAVLGLSAIRTQFTVKMERSLRLKQLNPLRSRSSH